jgi:chromosome segregation ATPase
MLEVLEANSRVWKQAIIVSSTVALCVGSMGWAKDKPVQTEKETSKSANVGAAQKLNGEQSTESTKKDTASSSQASATDAKTAKDTAKAVNNVPGVNVSQQDLQAPSSPPIKGFHPIKKILRPVENLEGMSIKLEQQIMKLEGPIASLQPPMKNLQTKMGSVDQQIEQMQNQLNGMQSQVTGVRSDLHAMKKQIAQLQEPIEALRKPITGVSKPLEQVQQQLNLVLFAIVCAAIAIAIGTPLAAVLVYRNRHKLFPDLRDHELPQVQPGTPTSTRR